jgi:hypothetical protein
MDFREFSQKLQEHITEMLKDKPQLFMSGVDKDLMWETYLNSFPPGTNEVYRERREYDCSCCRHFVKSFGNVVTIKDNKIQTIWDFKTNDTTFQPVVDALKNLVMSYPIKDAFVTREHVFGTEKNHEQLPDGSVKTWEHMNYTLPKHYVIKSSKTVPEAMGELRDMKNVFQRSLNEISKDAVETVLELISQNSLYKGEEWKTVLSQFLDLHKTFHKINGADNKEHYCWQVSGIVGGVISKIKNHSIGVLLTNISEGMELNEAVRKYEAIVAPTNYKRPKAVFTTKMLEQAQKKIEELGFLQSLERRHAVLEDITINNILYANRDVVKRLSGDFFSDLKKQTTKGKQFDRVEEVPVEVFVKDILPQASNVEVFLENKHSGNMVSLIAPVNSDSPTMFKWGNGFSWAYSGNITDSMKERVKAAGGNVEGVLRFSLQWNTEFDNRNDFDAFCIEPDGTRIYFGKKVGHKSGGNLDVDIIHPNNTEVAVENITWPIESRMQGGIYSFGVNNFTHRGGRSGFSAEIEYQGQIYSYDYPKELRQKEDVIVAKIKYNRKDGIKFIESLPSSTSSRTVWNLPTNGFHPVSVCMFSPNYWDEQKGIGHKHYFFMLKDCINEQQPNGFFNEFLREELMPHRQVLEALGSRMKVQLSENQLSGIGFSSTKRDSLVCKVSGSFDRTIKVIF